jgi:hypothetical protein
VVYLLSFLEGREAYFRVKEVEALNSIYIKLASVERRGEQSSTYRCMEVA